MDSIKAPSQLPIATPKKNTPASITTPIKGKSAVVAEEQFWAPTPEKPTRLSRPGRTRSVAFSVKEVRQAALGRHWKRDRGSDRSDRELALLEEQLRADRVVKASPSKSKNQINLPEKYQILCEIFNSMECSIRLLRLKGSMPTFSSLYARIQELANQNFTYKQLAQMKHILPEAIIIKKVLLRDEITCCMKPDLQISMSAENIGINMKEEGQNAYLHLRKVFRQRLVDFVRAHPEDDDIPEEELPLPFSKSNVPSSPKTACEKTSMDEPQSVILSHMPPSFQRRFFQKTQFCTQKRPLLNTSSSSDHPNKQTGALEVTPSERCIGSLEDASVKKHAVVSEATAKNLANASEASPAKKLPNASEATPAKFVSTPTRLMASTPEIEAPKRLLSDSCIDSPPNRRLETKRSARSLSFMSPNKSIKEKGEQKESASEEDSVLDFLPKSLLQSVKEKERQILVEKETGVADAVKRQRTLKCLPSTFNTILLIYRSMKRSVITKQELIHKIIANNARIVDREEVEDQLRLLQEIVPDWISEKTSLSQDILIRVNMGCSSEDIRQRLARAE